MKTTLFFICITLMFSCNKNTNSKNNEADFVNENASLEGAWELVSYLNYKDNGQIDSIISFKNDKQIKIYSDTKVMWSRLRASDTLDWFGYGNYTIKNDTLSEILDYGSKSMNNIIKERKAFIYKIIIGENTFTQIQTDSLGTLIYAENYVRLE